MPNKKISELTTGTASLTSIIPVSDAGGTVTNKVTVQSILNADARWSAFLPSAPTSLTVAGSNAQVALAWTAPTVLSVTPITDYVVQYSANSGSTWTTFSDGTSTTASATVTGLTNGTAYTFRVAAVNGVGQGAYSAVAGPVTPAVAVDPLFSSVALLLHLDGTGDTLVDSSASPKTVTAMYGSGATQSSENSKWGGKSAKFNNLRYIMCDHASLSLGTADFVIEFWLYMQQAYGGNSWGSALFSGGLSLFLNSSGVLTAAPVGYQGTQSAGGAVPFNQWVHIAAARSSGLQRVYVNGDSALSYTSGHNLTASQLSIGAEADNRSNTDAFKFSGFIDDFRITAGSARGYSGATISVPTAAFPDA